MSYWKGPHSKIISASKGLEEYRQIHLSDINPGLWPAIGGVETDIPLDRKIDGVAEVTFQSPLGPVLGRKQTQLAFKDEINVFRRTLLYIGLPGWSRWYDVAQSGETVGARVLVYLRRRAGVSAGEFRTFINSDLAPALAGAGKLRELRTQTFLPWSERLWDTPNVAHDNPPDQQFHASLILGFADKAAQAAFFQSGAVASLSDSLARFASAVHAYEMSGALTFVRGGTILPHYLE
ncbi:MAG: hypothetical protein ABL879_12880 [Devosia sp.]